MRSLVGAFCPGCLRAPFELRFGPRVFAEWAGDTADLPGDFLPTELVLLAEALPAEAGAGRGFALEVMTTGFFFATVFELALV